jgi:signal transduction histidine kinase
MAGNAAGGADSLDRVGDQATRRAPVEVAGLFAGPGDVRARCRSLDWAATPLGAVDGWPPSLRTAVDVCLASPFPMCLYWGPELVLLYNDRYPEVLGGAKHPWALGRRAREVWAEVWDQLAPEFAQVMTGGPAVWREDERFAIRRDGREVEAFFTYSFSPIRDETGAVGGVLNVFTETTERVRLVAALELERSRLAYVFQQAPAFLAVVRGPKHVFELVNDAYYQLVGHRELLGKPVAEALPEVAVQEFLGLLDGVLATGEPFVGREVPIRLVRTPGAPPEERFVDFVYLPLIEADGARAGVIAHGTDVTAQVRARRELEAANRRLQESAAAFQAQAEELQATTRTLAERTDAAEAAARLKTEFLATMSHEFRTPLNAILGYAQLLDMGVLGPATPAQQAHLERLQTSARHLLRLVDDVLDVAKVDADRLAVRADVLPTGAAVASALALIQPQATAKGIRVYDLGAMGPGVPYVGDEHRARQILVNVLSNAVKFTPPGGQITVSCGAAADPDPGVQAGYPGAERSGARTRPDGWAFVRVEDTGPGIAPELLSHLFEPFVQGDGALTREQGGTGLGLAISRRLARLMGGDLVVRSQPGAGATFTLWLPAPRPAATAGAGIDRDRPARRTPTGIPVIPEPTAGSAADGSPGTGALDAAAYAVLHALAIRLASESEAVGEAYVAALRAGRPLPGCPRPPRRAAPRSRDAGRRPSRLPAHDGRRDARAGRRAPRRRGGGAAVHGRVAWRPAPPARLERGRHRARDAAPARRGGARDPGRARHERGRCGGGWRRGGRRGRTCGRAVRDRRRPRLVRAVHPHRAPRLPVREGRGHAVSPSDRAPQTAVGVTGPRSSTLSSLVSAKSVRTSSFRFSRRSAPPWARTHLASSTSVPRPVLST